MTETTNVLEEGPVIFETDHRAPTAEGYRFLDRVASRLSAVKSARVELTGHADSTGNSDYNRELARGRAQAVRNHLVVKGVRPERIRVLDKGDASPVASNANPEGRAMNRRVEVRVIASTSP